MKYFLLIICLVLINACTIDSDTKAVTMEKSSPLEEQNVSSVKSYELKQKTENADIRYADFKNFNKISLSFEEQLKAFEPKKGRFTVYSFIAKYEDYSKLKGKSDCEDYIILKTNSKNNLILDGFQFTMGWAEPPSSFDLYKVNQSNIKLTDSLDIKILQFLGVENANPEESKYLNEEGRLQLK